MSSPDILKKLESGFLGFRVKNWRISFLVVALILGMGGLALNEIPKESAPTIKFGIIQINTIYPGVNPVDMDSLITDEIEQAVKDIDGIDSISSTSQVGVASTQLVLENDADTKEVLTDVKSEVDKLSLPTDAEDPLVTEVSTDNELMFNLLLYGPRDQFPTERLKMLAQKMKNTLEGRGGIKEMNISGGAEFDLEVLVNQGKAELLGVTPALISQTIRDFNRNTPLGRYEIGDLEYDFRIDGELIDEIDLLNIPVIVGDSYVSLRDVATINRVYKDTSITTLGINDQSGFGSVILSVNKVDGGSIFSSSASAKQDIESLLETSEFDGLEYAYSLDLSDSITDDYEDLLFSGLLTLVCVFLCLLLFVGFKESAIGTFAIILSFGVTFIVLNQIGLTLNFLTNFSLVLTLGVAIDTTIVIIEAAYENLKMGYSPKTAVLTAVRDFSAPLIAGTSTTLVVFIPMMVLPGVTGKFLAYIPITVFITLVAALFLSLTINSALFYKLSKPKKRFVKEEETEKFMRPADFALLTAERIGKEEKGHGNKSFRQRMLDGFSNRYSSLLRKFIGSRTNRWLSVVLPIIGLILTFIFLSPKIGFTLFPGGDNGSFNITIETAAGTSTESTSTYIPFIEKELDQLPELKQYTITVDGNELDASVELIDKDERDKIGLGTVFDVESSLLESLDYLKKEGLRLESRVEEGGPPQGKPVGLKLRAEVTDQFSELQRVAKDFAAYLRGIEGVKNVSISSKDTPGQFVFSFDRDSLRVLGLTPGSVVGQINAALNGVPSGSLFLDGLDADIKVKFDSFDSEVSPQNVGDIVIQSSQGSILLSDVLDYSIDSSVGSISREDTKISITVDADLTEEFGSQGTIIQGKFADRASTYQFPEGITFDGAGEGEENAELISAAVQGLVIALFLMLVILVLQFNSFRKPLIILYSVFLALLGVNIGLYLTSNPYSMSFFIGFVALTGIVVNDAIIFIDRINKNIEHDVDTFDAIIEAGRSRLQPIVLTTLTTLFGVLPIALQDEFWSGLGFTMIFGLFAGSVMTLFVIPSLYYMAFVKKRS